MTADRGKSVKNDDQYQALREQGEGRRKVVCIADAYEYWSEAALYEKARKVGIRGRSLMDKARLKRALRNR